MTCVTTIDWGSVADWVSGIGSMGAVIVALGIALSERRQSRVEKKEANKAEAQIENDLFVEALFLWRRIEASAQQLREASVRNGDYARSKEEWIIETTAVRETALRLQQLPRITVRNYREFENIIQFMRTPAFRRGFHIEEFRKESPTIKHASEYSSERIKENANPLAPLNW